MKNVFVIKIGGKAGFGIMTSSFLISKVATRSGYYVFAYPEYPSLIRGGHNVVSINISKEKIHCQYPHTNLLIALNQETIDLHKKELPRGGMILFDNSSYEKITPNKNYKYFGVPASTIVKEASDDLIMRNNVMLGAALALLGGDLGILKKLINEQFIKKNPKIAEKNNQVAQAGYDYILQNYPRSNGQELAVREKISGQILTTANEAISLGAIAGGLQFAAIYPMTPTSTILSVLAPLQEKYGFVYKQPEDEIAAINMAIGASFAGARSMVATSGGGFCLMSEGYGLAGQTETPIVIIEGMRGSPATGLPTWTEQGDLRFILHAHQGEFPRIILAPGDSEEAFYMTRLAFNLADRYQTPVVVLVDKYICESYISTAPFSTSGFRIDKGKLITKLQNNYSRYALQKDGISPRALPGSGNYFTANSDEHDAMGLSAEDSDIRLDQMDKRMKKLETCAKLDMPKPSLYGSKNADITLVSWGSNKGPILDAIAELKSVNYLHLNWINPFPTKTVESILRKAKKILNIECNYSGQMKGLIREKTGINIKHNLLKYDGRPFYAEEIINKVKKMR
ncbi:MAG: 2-oxoacid:acceptor oxidoreductase subunit alpha [Candidatus Buchananbacteria bacterium]|nr:2-oxoacid:acceptor oxidoreductase subunit alpha [Candidatus Buchananbacteria bacterium]